MNNYIKELLEIIAIDADRLIDSDDLNADAFALVEKLIELTNATATTNNTEEEG